LRGANDLLTHGIARAFRTKGYRWVCLGGGRTDAIDDKLLAFKRKFGKNTLRPLPLGFIVYDAPVFNWLCCSKADQQALMPQSADQTTGLPTSRMPPLLVEAFTDRQGMGSIQL
jgi:hypothetical protein